MKKTLLALATSAVLAAATFAPTPADARCTGCAVGAGIVGGLAAGAIIAGAAAGAATAPLYAYPQVYYPVAGYEPYYGYGVAPAYGCPGGYWARRPIRDPYGHVVGWSRPRFFCPAG